MDNIAQFCFHQELLIIYCIIKITNANKKAKYTKSFAMINYKAKSTKIIDGFVSLLLHFIYCDFNLSCVTT